MQQASDPCRLVLLLCFTLITGGIPAPAFALAAIPSTEKPQSRNPPNLDDWAFLQECTDRTVARMEEVALEDGFSLFDAATLHEAKASVAAAVGVPVAELSAALRVWAASALDPVQQGKALLVLGRYAKAARTLEAWNRAHPEDSQAYRYLGLAYFKSRSYPKAERAYRTALSEAPRDPYVLSGLGSALHSQGRYAESRDFSRAAVQAVRDSRGPDDRLTVLLQDHLASMILAQGLLEGPEGLRKLVPEVQRLREEVLESRLRTLGEDHPDTVDAMDQLAGALYPQGKLREALPLQEKVLAFRAQAFGNEHASTLEARWALLQTTWKLGDKDRWFPLLQEFNPLFEKDPASLSAEQRKVLGEVGGFIVYLRGLSEEHHRQQQDKN